MRKLVLAFGAVLLAAATGCGPQTRYVTATYWHTDSSGFLAYTQRPQVEAHVLLCTVGPDNTPTRAGDEIPGAAGLGCFSGEARRARGGRAVGPSRVDSARACVRSRWEKPCATASHDSSARSRSQPP
jgi:hypothetical protein